MSLLIGKDTSGNSVFRLVDEGVNPLTAGIANIIFDGSMSAVRIVLSGDVELDENNAQGGSKRISYPDLGFVPACLVSVYRTAGAFRVQDPVSPGGGGGIYTDTGIQVGYPSAYYTGSQGWINGVDSVVTSTYLDIFNRYLGTTTAKFRAKYHLFII